jgi:hypothetical protein
VFLGAGGCKGGLEEGAKTEEIKLKKMKKKKTFSLFDSFS